MKRCQCGVLARRWILTGSVCTSAKGDGSVKATGNRNMAADAAEGKTTLAAVEELIIDAAETVKMDDRLTDSRYQTWIRGPKLLTDDGRTLAAVGGLRHLAGRMAIGSYEPGRVCLGCTESFLVQNIQEMMPDELAYVFGALGRKAAYHPSGGRSATMTMQPVDRQKDGTRSINDICYICEPTEGNVG
ncbi:MAG: hypothetical protein RRZ24_03900 [Clostridia bacterium]